ncbi:hypothetical protein [Sphingomonas sp.]|uniref:hypothetical protein n=1 Tax=Sphingomonas sp. TaxID=28214 RepID=UPI0025DCD579|nr:hypothetical protein [Sphingomonas sp.]
MRTKVLLLSTGAVLFAAAGCTPVDPGFGEAVRYDMAVQTVDPDPQYPADALQPGYHGEKAQKATERYRKGTVKAVNSGGNGGNGSNGGGASGVGGGNTPGS